MSSHDICGNSIILQDKTTQPTIAKSSTEAWIHTGRITNYSIKGNSTNIIADNHRAVIIVNAHHPTRRTRQVEMKHFVILQWNDDEFINFIETRSDKNYSDLLSKPTISTKFYEHTSILPQYTQNSFTDDEGTIPSNYYFTPAVQNIFCSTFNLLPLFDLVHSSKFDLYE